MNRERSVKKLAAGTGGSIVVDRCQSCDSEDLTSLIFVGYLPPVNTMPAIGSRPAEQPAYPALALLCRTCQLVQLGLVVDPAILFPPTYPYTSGSTRILRENFAQLAAEVAALFPMESHDLIIDIGSNDGTLLSNFVGHHRVLGIEPTDAGLLAKARDIPTLTSFFNSRRRCAAIDREGKAKVVTAANVFAHIEDIHSVIDGVLEMLADGGLFITESHYLLSLVETVQYDTIYHEHLALLFAPKSQTPAGDARPGGYSRPPDPDPRRVDPRLRRAQGATARAPGSGRARSVEREALTEARLKGFRDRVVLTKMGLHCVAQADQGTGRTGLRDWGPVAGQHL